MKKLSIKLLQLGYPAVDLSRLVGWKSDFFKIIGIYHVETLPNSDGPDWEYSKDRLSQIAGNGDGVDITLAVTDKPLEDNYYMHRLGDKVAVLSLFETGGILALENIPPEVFVVRNLYELVLLYFEFEGKVSSDAYQIHHEDTRGCLYDFNAIKTDILSSTRKVGICSACKDRLNGRRLPIGFTQKFERELTRIKKPFINRLFDFVKRHPVWSIVISLVVSLVVNVASNLIYDVAKEAVKVWASK